MNIAVLGGGAAGLYFAISIKLRDPSHDVAIYERNRPDDTFGWGVVLSDETLQNLAANDPVSAEWIRRDFAYWDDIAVVYRGARIVSTGHGFCGIGRKTLLMLLQKRARELGVTMHFETEIADPKPLMQRHDLVVAADGLNSRARTAFPEAFRPDIDTRRCKFVWLGTRQKFDDAFTFIFEETEHGWVWAHAYQFDPDTATFIVECSQETFDRFGFAAMSQTESIATSERIFAAHLGGNPLLSNANHIRGSAWISFPAHPVRALVTRKPRADGRRSRERAFLHRLGYETSARKRDLSRVRTRQDTRPCDDLRELRGGATDGGA